MTYDNSAYGHPQPGNTQGGPGNPGPKRRLSKRMQATLLSLAAVVTLVAAGVIGYVVGAATHGETEPSHAAASAPASGLDATPAAATTTTTTPSKQFTPEDFRLDVTVVGQKCYGSAGCNVTYTVDPTYLSGFASDLDGQKLRVVYEVAGGEQPRIGNFTMDGTSVRMQEQMTIQTPSAAIELAAHVTKVIDRG